MSYREPTNNTDKNQHRSSYDYIEYDDYYDDVKNYRKSGEASKARRVIGKIILYLQAAVTILFVIMMYSMNFLPDNIMILLVIILVILWLIIFVSQRKSMNKMQALGMVLSIIVSIILAVGTYYLSRTDTMIRTVSSGKTYDISQYDVAVRADDAAQTLEDARNYTFAVQSSFHPHDLEGVIADIEQELGTEIKTVDMMSSVEQAQALMDGNIDAIIYNDAFNSTMIEQIGEFENNSRILKSFTVKNEAVKVEAVDVDVDSDAFLVFISGTDSEGQVSLTGRSDVNILAGLNTGSKQILLLTIPRDYYVEFPGITVQGARDKLTHAGIYGMDTLLASVQNLFGFDINYYIRVNFSSMMEIVDAIGGITVYNEQDFISHGGYHFPAGYIDMNGEYALHYVRERFAFTDGDFARGRNQIKVIQAMMDKLVSINTIANYTAITDVVSKFAATNIPSNDMTDLVKIQLGENPEWNLVSYQLLGEVMMQPCQSANGAYLSVDMPYAESIKDAQFLLEQLFDGEVLSLDDLPYSDADKFTYVTNPV